MPYKIKGKTVYKHGKVMAHAKTHASARRMVRLLRGVEHGWKPTGKK